MNKFLSFTPYPTSNEGLRQSVIALKTSFRHLLVWVVMFMGLMPFSSAQTNCGSTPDRLIFSGSYDCVTIGNTMSISEDHTNCGLLSSTSQNLTVPAGATIKAAYLYWSASGYIDHIVKFNGKQVVAEKTFIRSFQSAGFGGYDGFFGCRANVTNIVTGSGSYTLTDLSANTEALCSGNSVYAGWAMVVVYEQANLPTTNIHINNDAFDYTYCSTNTTTLNCINVPTNCVSNAKLTIVAFDGDAYVGELLTIGGTIWPDGNTFRGQSGPNLDIVNFDVSNKIIPGTTSLTYTIEGYHVGTIWGPSYDGLFDFVKILKYNTCQTPPPPVLCADGSPKKTPGAACNDNNPNTTNDVIQADGCGCAGTVPPPAICQQACTPIPVVRYKAPGCGGMLPIYPSATGFSNVTAGGFVKGSATEYNCYYSNDPTNYTPSAMGVNTSHFASPFYDWGVRFNATLTPTQIGSITGLKLLQRTLAGGSISSIDPNTCSPTKYAVRVLKDGQVVHEQVDVPLVNTTGSVGPTGYYYLNIDLSQVAALKFTQTTNFEFQLVAYDLSCKFNEFMTNGKGYWHFDTVELLACNQAGFTVTATNDSPKCNQPINLTATAGATTYKWSGPNGYTATGATATATASGTYTVTATSASGCTTTSSTVVVNTAKTPGTACNDNNPNTTNDVIQADGCGCAGTTVGPTCADGTPKKTPGTACNDNNPNTTNDVIQADGCSCAGTTVVPTCADGTPKKTPGTACNDYNPTTTNDVIQADGCGCAGTVVILSCADGTPKKTPGTACNDNNPNTTNDVIQADGCGCAGILPCTPYPNAVTVYKVTDSDPTCSNFNGYGAGVIFQKNTVSEPYKVWKAGSDLVFIRYANNTGKMQGTVIRVSDGLVGQLNLDLFDKVSNGSSNWTDACYTTGLGSIENFHYNGTLVAGALSYTIQNANAASYINIGIGASNQGSNYGLGGWPRGTIGGQAEMFANLTAINYDADNDGICDANDCQPNNPAFPTTPGKACNDNNPNTTNDVIQADGCTCAGTAIPKGSIGDFTFCDNNSNGVFDNGDTPQSGVQVQLCNANNTVIATATTDAQGKYLFPNLAAAIYIVKFPATITGGKTISTTNPITVNLGSGQNYLDADAGYKPNCNLVINITNKTCNNNGTPSNPNDDTYSFSLTVTGGTGSWSGSYNNSYLGVFQIPATPYGTAIQLGPFPAGSVTSTNTNPPITIPSIDISISVRDVQNANCTKSTVVTSTGTCSTTPLLGSIGDFTFNDNNKNGIYDIGDTPKSNILVTLCNSAGQTISTTLSVSGNYLFGNLPVGTYIVKFPPVHTDGKSLTTPQQITVNLTAGQNFVNADAGYNFTTSPKGSIGDLVFCDNNNNRVYDNGDTPISGVTVTLCNSSNVVLTTTTTNTSGNYSFGSLAAGSYIVKFPATLADGKAITTTNPITVSLTAGQNYTNADAGYYKPTSTTGSIGDFTFNDNNNNGIYDTGDTPKSNILVTLCNSAGQTISTTLSVSGNYLFGNLPAGTYIVKFPAVHTDGKSLTTPQQITVNLAAGQNYTSADAGYNFSTSPLGSIGDFVFCDNNNNRVFDNGDTPISGVTVTLCNSSNVVLSTTTTNSAGNYTFGSLAAGSYIVKFPATLTDGKAITTTNPITVNLTAGQNYTNADAGYYKATSATGSIGDFTFNDNNNNGIYDTGDTPKSSILVTLCNSAGQTITTTLSANGLYSFGNLAAGTYIVKFPAVHTDGKSLTTPQQITVNLAAGQNYVNADAGYYKPTVSVCSIGDFVFCDNNNNRVFDSGDTPISGVTVTLCNSSNVVITTTTTNTSGNYSFTNLAAGTYIVKFPTTLTDGKAITTTNPITVNLTTGQNYTNADAGYYKPSTGGTSSIKDVFVFCDNNKNQIYDAGDAPIQGVTVTLCNASNQVITTAITNADGAYSFLNLAAGTYIVKFPATLADGKAITTTNPITITLGTGETSSAADAGYYKPATLDCNATRDNSITRTCSNNIPVLTGTALAGYEYQWLSSTSVCPNNTSQAIAGATGKNYTLPSNVSQTTYFMRCARPIGCTSWDAVTESNCLTVNASDCTPSGTKCDAVIVKGNTDGTISVTGLGSYTSFVQVFNNLWQSVSNQEYSQSSVSIPVKNGTYSVNVLLYDASNGGWIFLCEKTVSVVVTGGVAALSKNTILDINAFAEAQRAQIQWVNNTGSQNDFFTVEKLNNTSGNFEKIEIVNSKPTEGNEVYNVYDNAITEGANTYRVQLTMLDGQVKTSALKTLTYKNLNDIRIYPNPASDYIEVDLKQYEGKKVTLYIYNQVGKIVHTQQIERASATPIHLDIDRQTSGQMLLRVMAEGRREVTKKFIIQN